MQALVLRKDGQLWLSSESFRDEAAAAEALNVAGNRVLGLVGRHWCSEGLEWLRFRVRQHMGHFPLHEE